MSGVSVNGDSQSEQGDSSEAGKYGEGVEHGTGQTVSMDEVLERLLNRHRLKPSDFQGAWKMTDKEAKEFCTSLRGLWSRWKYPSARFEHGT